MLGERLVEAGEDLISLIGDSADTLHFVDHAAARRAGDGDEAIGGANQRLFGFLGLGLEYRGGGFDLRLRGRQSSRC